jgi:hypothetical protein
MYSLDSDESINPQSGIEVKKQTVTFMDARDETMNDIPHESDTTRSRLQGADVSLGNFLSRPLKIASYEWSPTTTFSQTFDPWTLFLTNPRVSNRISNYMLARMNLHLKFVINGNSFFYGRLMACYQPFEVYDDLTVNAGLIEQDNVQMSQFRVYF